MGYAPGTVVGERFRLLRVLGRGGMAVVYEAYDLVDGRHLAVKMLEDEVRREPVTVERFFAEGRATRELHTAFVARTHGEGVTENGTPFLAMEFLDGKDLGALIRKRERLPWAEAVGYVIQACAGMAAAHDAGIIHRDLKPANLFLSITDDDIHVRVLDFGVAKTRTARQELTGPNGFLGTTAYMAPEQLRCARDVDARSDVWALGVILYRAITGTMPVRGSIADMVGRLLDDQPLPRITQLDVPRALAKVIARAMDKNPNGRPPNARAFARALMPFAERSRRVDAALEEIDRAEPSVVVFDGETTMDLAPPCRPPSASMPMPDDGVPPAVAAFGGISFMLLYLGVMMIALSACR